jgi:hypothetical protein
MLDIRWRPAPGQTESLAAALQAVLARAGAPRPYDELVSLLGLGSLTVAVPGECLGWWPAHARDAALAETAAMLGLRLRELHPPAAAERLADAAEFVVHFRDSYMPLMRAALEHEQLLLAWCGWPAPLERHWGLVNAYRGNQFSGYTLGTTEPAPLIGPALQVYVVEAFEGTRELTPSLLFDHAARVTVAGFAGRLPVGELIRTGRRAYETWRAATVRPEACPRCAERSYRCQARFTAQLAAVRGQLAHWLRGLAAELAGARVDAAGDWAATCGRVVRRFEHFTSADHLHGQLATEAGRAELAAAIDETSRLEGAICQQLARDAWD